MLQKHTGFSLIELMIVVMIISILSLLALPAYQSYAQKARFTEVISTAHAYQLAVALALQTGIPLKEINLGENGIPDAPSATTNLASLSVENGIITATGTEAAGNATLILTPSHDGSHFTLKGSCLKLGYCHA